MNILLIEDDDDIRELLAVIFETKLQANIIQASTAKSALSILDRGDTIDCVFSDYHLPDGTSGTVFKKMTDTNKHIPFILCSSENPTPISHFQERKVSAFIQKPFDTHNVVDVVSKVMIHDGVIDGKLEPP